MIKFFICAMFAVILAQKCHSTSIMGCLTSNARTTITPEQKIINCMNNYINQQGFSVNTPENEFSIGFQDYSKYTPLIIATNLNSYPYNNFLLLFIKTLLSAPGIDINRRAQGTSALKHAIEQYEADIVLLLLNNGARDNSYYRRCNFKSCRESANKTQTYLKNKENLMQEWKSSVKGNKAEEEFFSYFNANTSPEFQVDLNNVASYSLRTPYSYEKMPRGQRQIINTYRNKVTDDPQNVRLHPYDLFSLIDEQNNTILMWAIKHGKTKILEFILRILEEAPPSEYKSNFLKAINYIKRDFLGYTITPPYNALDYAIENQKWNAAKRLLDVGIPLSDQTLRLYNTSYKMTGSNQITTIEQLYNDLTNKINAAPSS